MAGCGKKMAKGGKIKEYGGKETYKSKAAMMKHEKKESPMMEKKEGMKKGGSPKNWIKDAIKKPGALKKSLGIKKDEKIPAGKLAKAAKAPGKLGQRARLAQTLKKMK